MSVLIYTDSADGTLTKNAFEAANYGALLAKKEGKSATAIVIGEASDIDKLGAYGITKVLHVNDAALNNFDPQRNAGIIAQAVACLLYTSDAADE